MKTIITLFIFMITSMKIGQAICIDENIVFPKGDKIATNSLFLFDFPIQQQGFKNELRRFNLYAVNQKGKKIKLIVLQENYSGTRGQIMLKPVTKFHFGDSISIKAIRDIKLDLNITLSEQWGDSTFKWAIEYRKWKVVLREDNEAPKWISDSIKYTFSDSRNSTDPGFSFLFEFQLSDNSFDNLADKIYSSKMITYPVLYEITFNNQRYFCTDYNLKTFIYDGNCGRNFKFGKIDTLNSALIRPMDSCGNYADYRTVSFTSPPYSPDYILKK